MTESRAVAVDRGWHLIIRDLGVRPEDVLRRAQLPADLFSRENARLTTAEYFRLWDALVAETGSREFGAIFEYQVEGSCHYVPRVAGYPENRASAGGLLSRKRPGGSYFFPRPPPSPA